MNTLVSNALVQRRPRSMHSKYLLIVEDERPVRQMMSFALRRNGFQVAEAADAESAQLSVSARRPDLALIDWMLPTTSGLDLARTLKSAPQGPAIPIIMVTARVEEPDRVAALDYEAFQFDRLIQTVRGIGYRFSTRLE